jgi:hypothetical protein
MIEERDDERDDRQTFGSQPRNVQYRANRNSEVGEDSLGSALLALAAPSFR